MKTAELQKESAANTQNAGRPFFGKGGHSFFSGEAAPEPQLFFGSQKASSTEASVQKKCDACEQPEKIIQRQETPEAPETKPASPDSKESATSTPKGLPARAGKCLKNPEFPDFLCLTSALKLDIDENLWNNAHQFYQVALLHPGDNKLMLDTFLRYGIGVNLLQTGFGFAGAGKKSGDILSYGTGIALKSYDFFKNGQLKLDIPIPLGKGVNLDIKFDLNADPDNLSKVKGVDTMIGISGHFK